jgi:magnesium transporter
MSGLALSRRAEQSLATQGIEMQRSQETDSAMLTAEPGHKLATRLRSALRVPPGDGGDLAMIAALQNRHHADIAEAMSHLANPECLAIFNWLDNARAAEVLGEVDADTSRYLMENAPPGRLADLLDRMPMDDAAEAVSDASPERAAELLADLEVRAPEDAVEIRELLA